MAELRVRTSTASLAIELSILTATRSSEVLNAQWQEFDLDKAIWTIPATRMKAGHAHRIPLTDRTLDILRTLTLPRRMGVAENSALRMMANTQSSSAWENASCGLCAT